MIIEKILANVDVKCSICDKYREDKDEMRKARWVVGGESGCQPSASGFCLNLLQFVFFHLHWMFSSFFSITFLSHKLNCVRLTYISSGAS